MSHAQFSAASSASSITDDSTAAQIIEVNFGKKKPPAVKGASHNAYARGGYAESGTESGFGSSEREERRESGEDGLSAGGGGGRSLSYLQHSELVNDIQKDIKSFFSKSVLTSYMSRWAKAFLAVAALSVAFTITFGSILLAEVYDRTMALRVEDGSVCAGGDYLAPQTSTLWYNIALIFLANVFMVLYALRGMALEKWGTALCYIIAALTAVGRALYTVAGGLPEAYRVPSGPRSACVVGLSIGAAIALISLGLLYKAIREFGWRNYVKGATTQEQVREINKYQLLDLFLKLDVMLCVHTIVSIFFAVDSTAMIIVSAIVIAFTVAMLVLITYFIKKQIAWFIYAFVALCPAMPILYIYLIVSQSILETSRCQNDSLFPCLGRNITVGLANYSDHALFERSLPPPAGAAASTQWFLVPEDCLTHDLNGSLVDSPCVNASLSVVSRCCGDYGVCQYTQEFFRTDQVLLIMLAVAGVVVRILTVVTTYKRMREMDSPIIRELLERGQRNLRSFTLIFVREDDAAVNRRRAASRVDNDDSHDASVHGTQLDAVLMKDA